MLRVFCHCLLLTLCCAPVPLVAEPEVGEKQLVEQWLLTERLLSSEKVSWEEEKAHTSQLLTLYGKELAFLDEELAKAGKSAPLVDDETEKLKKSIAATEKTRRAVIGFLRRFKPQVQQVTKRFPKPLVSQLSDDLAALDPEVGNGNVADVLRAVIRILQQAATFDRSYTFEDEVITLDGTDYTARVMYFGLSHGYFLAGKKAGIAKPGENGWVYTERSDIAEELIKAFAIQAKERPSGYFQVPLQNTAP